MWKEILASGIAIAFILTGCGLRNRLSNEESSPLIQNNKIVMVPQQ